MDWQMESAIIMESGKVKNFIKKIWEFIKNIFRSVSKFLVGTSGVVDSRGGSAEKILNDRAKKLKELQLILTKEKQLNKELSSQVEDLITRAASQLDRESNALDSIRGHRNEVRELKRIYSNLQRDLKRHEYKSEDKIEQSLSDAKRELSSMRARVSYVSSSDSEIEELKASIKRNENKITQLESQYKSLDVETVFKEKYGVSYRKLKNSFNDEGELVFPAIAMKHINMGDIYLIKSMMDEENVNKKISSEAINPLSMPKIVDNQLQMLKNSELSDINVKIFSEEMEKIMKYIKFDLDEAKKESNRKLIKPLNLDFISTAATMYKTYIVDVKVDIERLNSTYKGVLKDINTNLAEIDREGSSGEISEIEAKEMTAKYVKLSETLSTVTRAVSGINVSITNSISKLAVAVNNVLSDLRK